MELLVLLSEALDCFSDETQPLWQRTVDGMRIMEQLPFFSLPKQLQKEVDQADEDIARILQAYNLKSARDYQFLSTVELLRIQTLQVNTIASLQEILLPHQ